MSDEPLSTPAETKAKVRAAWFFPETRAKGCAAWFFWRKHWTKWWQWGLWRGILHEKQRASEGERQVTLGEYQVLLGVIAVILGGIAVFPLLRDIRASLRDERQARLRITSIENGEVVGLGQKIQGNTPFPEMNHYILVTTVSTKQTRIERAYVNRSDGTFSGNAQFGEVETGLDDEYEVRVFATTSDGKLQSVPRDATSSDPVKVRRALPDPVVFLGVTFPAEGSVVGLEEVVRGRTSLLTFNHYVVVTPLRIGTAYVQDERASVSNGMFSGRARFGGVEVGRGEKFSVRVVATRATLPAGPLISEEGTISSNAVTVTRK